MALIDRIRSVGPGAMVAAAFIGPGTVTTASVTGAAYGYALIWTIVFSVVATIVLQEMSARLGLVSREGLGEALRNRFDTPALSYASITLVVSAIGIGTAAYETGNIVGGAAGLETMTGVSASVWGPLMGLVAAALLWTGLDGTNSSNARSWRSWRSWASPFSSTRSSSARISAR